jgi:hypothetical protein
MVYMFVFDWQKKGKGHQRTTSYGSQKDGGSFKGMKMSGGICMHEWKATHGVL